MPPVRTGSALAAALMLSGCVTTVEPRAFAPVVRPPPADTAAFQRDFLACVSEITDAAAVFYRAHYELKPVKADGDEDLLVGGGAIGPGDMGSGVIGALAMLIMTVRGAARSSGRQAHRAATEHDIQAAMTSCLKQRGHVVAAWERVKDSKAGGLQTPTEPSARAQLAHEAEEFERFADEEPKRRAEFLKIAAEKYERLAEGVGDPQQRALYVARAADARRKAEEAGRPVPSPDRAPARR